MTEDEKTSYAPHIVLVMVQVMFGTSTVLGKWALMSFPSVAIVGFRVGGGALAFYLLTRISGNLALEKRSHYLYFALFSVFGISLNQLLFFKGLSLTTATNASLLAVLIPVFAIVVSAIIGHDTLSWKKAAGVILAGLGVIYLIDPSNASFADGATTTGDLLILANSCSYAIYLAISKKLITKYGSLKSIAWLFLFGSIVNVPFGLYSMSNVDALSITWQGWAALGLVVLIPTILAYYWNTWALARVQPSVVAVYVYLQPLIGAFLAMTVLGERWNPRILLAVVLIFAGVYLVTRRKKMKRVMPA